MDQTLRLILMRHGEAEEGRGMADHARRLTARGAIEVRKVAAELKRRGVSPRLALSSDSTRTKDTAMSANLELPFGLSWVFTPKLYLAGLEVVKTLMDSINSLEHREIILLGHNPGFSNIASVLAGEPLELVPAAAVILTVSAASWTEAFSLEAAWTLEALVNP